MAGSNLINYATLKVSCKNKSENETFMYQFDRDCYHYRKKSI